MIGEEGGSKAISPSSNTGKGFENFFSPISLLIPREEFRTSKEDFPSGSNLYDPCVPLQAL
jgi:hypothetical protein